MRFQSNKEVSPPGPKFSNSPYAACTLRDGKYIFSTFSSEKGLVSYMQTFKDEISGVRVNKASEDMESTLDHFFNENGLAISERDDVNASIYGDTEPLTYPGETLEESASDDLFQYNQSKQVQEVI